MAEEQAQPTLRETIVESIETVREDTPAEVVAPVEETTEQREQRARDEQGRFTKAEKTEGQDKTAASPPAVTAEVPAPEPSVPKPPSSWKKDLWPVWEALHKGQITPEQAKALVDYIPQREQQFATGVSTYKNIADSAKPLMDAVAPYQADLDRHGLKAPDMVGRLMHAHRTLALGSPQEKLELFGKLANDYGIPLRAFFDQELQQRYLATPHTPAPQPQPDVQTLIHQALEQRELQQTIQSIEKDTQNYPFFQYVRSTMAQLLETNEATDLNDAYHKALERPEHAALVSAMQNSNAQAEAQRQAEAKRVAAGVARSNAVSPKSATPMGTASANGKGTVRDALTAAIEQHRTSARV